MSADNAAAVPSVKLPKAVRMQADQANEIYKQEAERVLKEAQSGQSQTKPDDTPPVTPVTAEVTPSPVVTAPEKTPEELAKYWEHRFKTSRGMDEAEKTRLKTENSDLRAKNSALEKTMRELEDRVRAVERQAPTNVDLKKYLTEEQIDTYGPDVLQSVAKVARLAAEEAAERRIKEEVDRRVRPVEEKLQVTEKDAQSSREAAFWDALEDKMPDWVVINDNPKFHEWLAQKDPFTGYTRQNLLEHAQSAFDPMRVVAMFEAFKQSSPAPKAPTVNTQQRVVPDPVGQTAIVTQSVPDVGYVKTSEISRFYDDCKLGRYKYRPQEKEVFEKRIREAQLTGRIIKDTK